MVEAFYHDPAFTIFYDAANPWGADFDFCAKAAGGATSLLDLGCGTGMLAAKLGETLRRVVAVDPAEAMLAEARKRPGGDKVRWVCADARRLDLGETFDLITMTGHAFQCLITDADQAAVLATMKAHLAPGGRVLFDMRNPLAKAYETWTEDNHHSFDVPPLGRVQYWHSHTIAGEIVTYRTQFKVLATQEVRAVTCRLRFRSKAALDAALRDAGLNPEPCFGDWRGTPWAEDMPEIIYHGGHL